MKKIWKNRKQILGLFFSFVLVLSLLWLPHIEVKAASFDNSISNCTTYSSGCLKSISITIDAVGSYATAYGKIAIHTQTSKYGWNNRWTYDGSSSWPASIANDGFITWGSGNEFLWSDGNPHPVTVEFPDNVVNLNNNQTYYVYLWTRAPSYGIYPDALVYTLKTSGGKLTDSSGNVLVDGNSHTHNLQRVPEIKATCTAKGTKAHYRCSDSTCGKLFADSQGLAEKTLADLEIPATGHSWEYNADANVITAKCSNAGCTYNANELTLALNADDSIYSGDAFEGVNVEDHMSSVTGVTVGNVQYYEVMSEGATAGGVSLGTTAPTDAGYYYATLTVQNKTARMAFKIDKATQNAVVNMSGYTFSEDETAQLPTPTVSGAQESLEITYYYNTTESTEGAKEWKDIKADTLLPGTYYMYAVLGDTTNYNGGTTDFTEFVVSKGNMTDIDAEPVVKIYDGIATGITLTGVPEGATVKYGLSEDACDLEESPTIKDVTESPCTVYYTVEKSGYETVSGQATITISPKTAELVWSGDSFVYDGKTHSPSVVVNNLVENDVCVVTVSGGKKDAGDAYVAQAVELSNSNYVLPEITTKTFSITQRTLGLEWQDETTFKYNSLEQGVIATPVNVVEGDSVTLTYIDNMKKDVGTYTAKVTGVDNANYALPENVEQTYKIEKQAMNDSGSQISISVDKDGNTKVYCETDDERIELVEDVDYTVEKTEDGYIKIIGIGGYESEIKVKQPEAAGDGNVLTTVVVETEAEEIKPFLAPVTDTNAKNTLLNVIKSDAVKERVAAGENVDYDATLYLKLLDAAATASDDEKTLISEQIKKDSSIPSDAKVGMYLDLTLYMSYSVSDSSGLLESGTDKIKDTSDEKMGTGNGYNQKITITIPEELRNTNEKIKRKYYVIRVHEDENGVKTAELIASIQEGYNLTFETDKFSIYAVAYSDEIITKIETNKPDTSKDTTVQVINNTSAPTGDNAAPFTVMSIMIIVLVCLLSSHQKEKN